MSKIILEALNYLLLLCISIIIPFLIVAIFYILTLCSFCYIRCVRNPLFIMVDIASSIMIFVYLVCEYNRKNNEL